MARPAVAPRFGRAVPGTDVDRIRTAMRVSAEIPYSAAILDVPCGSRIAMLRLRPDQRVGCAGVDYLIGPRSVRGPPKSQKFRRFTPKLTTTIDSGGSW